ncbi:DUF2207 domain-containing protein [Weissella viridescens]|uniref:DUF2207 domain-containing protein n=1 Tax=Weissella viridescens TaxID=1629 RepID=A0A3P2RD79_WEIVI|nr:DUF2207 domain-containing protein [Weissella viridescens]RRG18593.1 DUF2207 domain-containing protein [Weissella viridescens]
MKNKLRMWLGVLVAFVMFGVGGATAFADSADQYDITKYDEHVQFQKDGTAHVTVKMTYAFNKSMHGVYFQQGLGEHVKQVGPVQASVNGVAAQPYNGGDTGLELQSYQASSDQEKGVRFKLYHPVAAGDTIQVTWQYTLSNLINSYNDVDELNWRIIGNNWDVPFDQMQLTVAFPQQPLNDTRTWQHGKTATKGKWDGTHSRWTFSQKDYPSQSPLELHMMLPKTTFNPNAQVHRVNDEGRQKILKQEAQLQRQAAQRKRTVQIIEWVLIAGTAVCLLSAVWFWKRTRPFVAFVRNDRRLYDVPDDHLAPAVVGERLSEEWMPTERSLSATYMDMIARHYVAVEEDPQGRRKDKRFKLVKDPSDLALFEQQALQILFREELVVGATRRSRKLKLSEQESRTYRKQVRTYRKQVQQASQTTWLNLKEISALKKGIKFGWYLLIAIFLGQIVLLAIDESVLTPTQVYGTLIGVVLAAVIVFWRQRYLEYDYTGVGLPHALAWHQYANMLGQIGRMPEREIEEVVLWDRLMAYAVILDEGKTVAKELKKLDLQAVEAAPLNDLLIAFALIGPYQIRTNTAVATPSSGSGLSFGAGGTSGGFGGSSGGGAF